MILFAEKTEKHSTRIAGNSIEELIAETMKYVTRHRDFYEKNLREDLETKGDSVVSRHSTHLNGSGIIVILDTEGVITDSDLSGLGGKEFYRKYIN
jgi:hypothetical protein